MVQVTRHTKKNMSSLNKLISLAIRKLIPIEYLHVRYYKPTGTNNFISDYSTDYPKEYTLTEGTVGVDTLTEGTVGVDTPYPFIILNQNDTTIYLLRDNITYKVEIQKEGNKVKIISIESRDESYKWIFNYSNQRIVGVENQSLHSSLFTSIQTPKVIDHIGSIDVISRNHPIPNKLSIPIWPCDTLIVSNFRECYLWQKRKLPYKVLFWSSNNTLENMFGLTGYTYIVINSAYGGYSIPKIIKARYLELKASGNPPIRPNDDTWVEAMTSSHGASREEDEDEDWDDDNIDREDPYLVQAVLESTINDRKSRYSCLHVVRVHNNYSYEIHEYDGLETIRKIWKF